MFYLEIRHRLLSSHIPNLGPSTEPRVELLIENCTYRNIKVQNSTHTPSSRATTKMKSIVDDMMLHVILLKSHWLPQRIYNS